MVTSNGLLILIRGLPGSGKSTLAKKLIQTTFLSKAKLLDPDEIDFDSPEFIEFHESQPKDLPPKTLEYRFLLRSACDILSNNGQVIWGQPWRDLGMLRLTLEKINEMGYKIPRADEYPFRVILVQIIISIDVARHRIMLRNQAGKHKLTVKDFKVFDQESDSPEKSGLSLIVLDGTVATSEQVVRVLMFLNESY